MHILHIKNYQESISFPAAIPFIAQMLSIYKPIMQRKDWQWDISWIAIADIYRRTFNQSFAESKWDLKQELKKGLS